MKHSLQLLLLTMIVATAARYALAAPCAPKPCPPPCVQPCPQPNPCRLPRPCPANDCWRKPCPNAYGYAPAGPVHDHWVDASTAEYRTTDFLAMTGQPAPIVSYIAINYAGKTTWSALAERTVAWPAAAGGTNGAYTTYYIAYPVRAKGAAIKSGTKPRRVLRDLRPGYCPTLWRWDCCR
jgi:hypothetical protein